MKFKSLFLGLIFALFSTLSADTFIQEATYTMGDDDSKLTAKNKAILIAKREAIEQAGVQITSYSKSVQGLLKDDIIESFSSSLMMVTILDKKFNYPNYWVKIEANIDIGLLNKKLKQFSQSGINIDDQISSAQNEIEEYNKKANQLIAQRNKRNELKNLLEKKKQVIKKVNNLANNKAIDLNIIKNRDYGYITVTSNVKDAEIYIDGKYVGYAPIERFKVPSGKDIELKAVADKRYYPDDSIKIINIKKLTTPSYKIKVKEGKANIFLVGEDGKLFVNDKYERLLNKNNRVVTINAGNNTTILISNGFKSTNIVRDIYANNTYEIKYKLSLGNKTILLEIKNWLENIPSRLHHSYYEQNWLVRIFIAFDLIAFAWILLALLKGAGFIIIISPLVLYGVSYILISILYHLMFW